MSTVSANMEAVSTPYAPAGRRPLVVGILGPPGSGKGTQCKLLSQKFKVEHISIGEILREEMDREGSPYEHIIRQNMIAGTVGPTHITMAILKSRMETSMKTGMNCFILDGFPRNMEQVQCFEAHVVPFQFFVLLKCSEYTCQERLLSRERCDDQVQSIQNRFYTFNWTTSLVLRKFDDEGRLNVIDAEQPVEQVHRILSTIVAGIAAAPVS